MYQRTLELLDQQLVDGLLLVVVLVPLGIPVLQAALEVLVAAALEVLQMHQVLMQL
jgi:ABC-type transport system involved in cytochrome c biogenesis permease component